MKYPTAAQVESADQNTLALWVRFLQSPGWSAVGRTDFQTVMLAESKIMDRIIKRFEDTGGFTPGISKSIGWDHPKY